MVWPVDATCGLSDSHISNSAAGGRPGSLVMKKKEYKQILSRF